MKGFSSETAFQMPEATCPNARTKRQSCKTVNYEESDDEDVKIIISVPSKRKKEDLEFEIEIEDTKVEKKTKLEKRDEIALIKPQEYPHNTVLTNESVLDKEGVWNLDHYTSNSKPLDYFMTLCNGIEIDNIVTGTNQRLFGISNSVGFLKSDFYKYIGNLI